MRIFGHAITMYKNKKKPCVRGTFPLLTRLFFDAADRKIKNCGNMMFSI